MATKPSKHVPHLKMRNGRWSFRMRVPKDLKGQLGTEVTRDLGTANKRKAESLAKRYRSDLKGIFTALRNGAQLGEPVGDPKALIRRIADAHLERLQRQIDADLGEEVTSELADLQADAYAEVGGILSEQVEDGEFGDLLEAALKELPPGTVVNLEMMKPIAATIARKFPNLSFDVDRTPRAKQAPEVTPPVSAPATISKRLGEALQLYLDEKVAAGKWENEKATAYLHCRQFIEHVGENERMDTIEPGHVLEWVGGLRTGSDEPLHIATRNNRITAISGFYRRGMDQRWCTWNPATSLHQTDEREAHEKRDVFTMDEMQTFFGPLLLEEGTKVRGGKSWPSRCWVPLLVLGAGMRVREAAQLAVEDVTDIDGILCARVTADLDDQGKRGRRRVKNASSRRYVPIHPELERKGFRKYVEARGHEVAGDEMAPLFPDCGTTAGISSFTNWASKYLTDLDLKRPRLVFYSLRHNFTTQLSLAEVPERAQRQMVGHSAGADAHAGYIKARDVKGLAGAVFPALDEWLPEVLKNLPAA